MFNQSFSGENFRKVLDYENRKGIYLEGEFFPEVARITKRVKILTAFLREQERKLSPIDFDKIGKPVSDKIEDLKAQKKERLDEELRKISEQVTQRHFGLQLTLVPGRFAKPIYTLGDSKETYFVSKQLQTNVRKVYVIKQANRLQILSQLKNILADEFPKTVVRTDIQGFYESIPHEKLLAKLNRDSLLTLASKNFISQIIRAYKLKTGLNIGVPRGVGISAYLAELYMRDVDRDIREIPGLSYYARYVDDIIAIFTPTKLTDNCNYKAKITRILSGHSLKIHTTGKTKCFKLCFSKKYRRCAIEYLGYSISTDGRKRVGFALSNNKLARYAKRIAVTFAAYRCDAYSNERKARRLLIKRLRFFTSNAHLLNSKGHILVGIHFSNMFLTDLTGLDKLDAQLQAEFALISKPSCKCGLMRLFQEKKIGFRSGFEAKRFLVPTAEDMSQIHGIWNYEK